MPKILKLRGKCSLSIGHFRSAIIDFTKADALYSIETIDNQENLYGYCEVLIDLIKSEILCNNLDTAWFVREKGIRLVSDHQFKGNIYEHFLYFGAKCLNILSERGDKKEQKLDKAVSLCLQAVYSLGEHVKWQKVGFRRIGFDSHSEMQLLLVDIWKKRKLKGTELTEGKLQMVKTYYMHITDAYFAAYTSKTEPEKEPETKPYTLQLEREAQKAMTMAEIGLEKADLVCENSDSDKIHN